MLGNNGEKSQPKTLSSWDVNVVLRQIFDFAESGMLSYVLLGDVAKQLYDGVDGFNGNELKVDKVEWGLQERYLTQEVKSLFQSWGFKPTEKGYYYEQSGVPVYLHIIKRKYKFFEIPDMRFYQADYFKLPNPFENYYKSRGLIQ